MTNILRSERGGKELAENDAWEEAAEKLPERGREIGQLLVHLGNRTAEFIIRGEVDSRRQLENQ